MRIRGIVEDDKAQALAEFVLVFPVIILVFMLIIQHLIIVQAALVGNYAAYVACRVYAVRASLDPDDAEEKATTAAALVYAPVSRMMPGELSLPVGSPDTFLPAGAQSVLENIAPLGNIVALGSGYAVARYVRLNKQVSGGSVNISTTAAPGEVIVEINYAQPVLIPGLAEIWKLTGGKRDINKDLAPMGEGLDGWSPSGMPGMYPVVNVKSKCAMGMEDWGSDADMYRPRKRKTVKDEEVANPELEKNAAAQKEAQEECKEASDKVQQKQAELQAAQAELDAAQAQYDSVMADPASTDAQKLSAQTALNIARSKRDEKRWEYDMARNAYEEKRKELEELAKGPG